MWNGRSSRILYLGPVATNFTAPPGILGGHRSPEGGAYIQGVVGLLTISAMGRLAPIKAILGTN